MGSTWLCVLGLFLLETLLYGHAQVAVATRQSSWSEIYYGETITLKCQIEDGGYTEWEYTWSTTSPDTLQQDTESNVIVATVHSSGSYHCMGKDEWGSSYTAWSNPITVTVSAKPKAKLSYDNRDIPVGGSVTLTCSVNPSSYDWTYYFYRGEKTSEPLTTQDFELLSNGQIRVSQGGAYWCIGGRGDPVYYTEDSDSISINKIVANKAVVTLQPNWSEIYREETFTLRCEISDGLDTEWDYEWKTTSSYKPSKQSDIVRYASTHHSGNYTCKGRMKSEKSSTDWSDPITLAVYNTPKPVVKVSPAWPTPGDSVTLSCEVQHHSAEWRFYWYKAVPDLSYNYIYNYQLLPGSSNVTEEDSYILHGQIHTAGYVCRAGRGDPVIYTFNSEQKFVWSGDVHASASLKVNPDSVQHFTSDSVSVNCDGNSTSWRVMRFSNRYHSYCSVWGRMTGSTCNINSNYQSDAVYWCESGSGEFSNAVNITLQDKAITLVSPAHPVTEGDSVFLGCKLKSGKQFVSNVFFYRNEILIQNDSTSDLSISAVSKSDEGFYKCQHSGLVSPQSWMSVKAKSRSQNSSFPVLLTVGLIFGFLLFIIVILLLLYRYRWYKDSGLIRPVQSENTNQDSGHINNQNGALNQAPSSEADEYQDATYSVIDLKKIGKKEADESPDVTYSLIDLKKIGKKGKSIPAATDDTVYSEVKPGTTLGL